MGDIYDWPEDYYELEVKTEDHEKLEGGRGAHLENGTSSSHAEVGKTTQPNAGSDGESQGQARLARESVELRDSVQPASLGLTSLFYCPFDYCSRAVGSGRPFTYQQTAITHMSSYHPLPQELAYENHTYKPTCVLGTAMDLFI